MTELAEPLACELISFDAQDNVGRLRTAEGELIKVGYTAFCGELITIGDTYFVTVIGDHPLGGRKAFKVRPTATTERQLRDQAAAAEVAAHKAAVQATAERHARGRAATAQLPSDDEPFSPMAHHIVDELSGPSRALWDRLHALPPEARGHLESFGIILFTPDDEGPEPFYDPSFFPFATDGGGNDFGLYLYPGAVQDELPVVIRDHEDAELYLVADALPSFLGAWIHRQTERDEEDDPWLAAAARSLIMSLQLYMHVNDELAYDRERRRYRGADDTLGQLSRPLQEEREDVTELLVATFEEYTGPEVVERVLRLLDVYRSLGWERHHRHLLWQARTAWAW